MVARVLRTLQSYAPFIRPAKFAAYNMATRMLGWRIEPDFELLSRLESVGLVLDVGANWGQSIHAFKRTARPDRIVSFEPNPILGARLQRVMRGDPRVQIEQCALGEMPGRFELYVPRYRNYVYDGLASLSEEAARAWLNPERMAAFDPAKLSIDRFEVEVRTLDSYGFSPDVVKIDVQGFELEVVKGGRETFRRSRPITIVETPPPELVALLAELDMHPYRWTGGELVPNDLGGLNTLFLDSRRRAALKL